MLDETAEVRARMWEIRRRHEAGSATAGELRGYVGHWQTLALRRSVGRRTFLPATVDDLLADRRRLTEDIQAERARQAVEDVFATATDTGALPA